METVVIVIMISVVLAFLLKLSCHGLPGMVVLSAAAALFTVLSIDYAVSQSKSRIEGWLGDPALMLDISVLLTIDVALQIAFCFLRLRKTAGETFPKVLKALYLISLWLPGIMIFPVLTALLVEAVFAFPGVDFNTLAMAVGAAVLVLAPILALALRMLLPQQSSRLELLFLVSLLTASLGIIATVNGRTATAGTAEVDLSALLAVIALLAGGTVAGLTVFRFRQKIHSSRERNA